MLKPTLLLAPMQAITDAILRGCLTKLGGIDACVSVYARVSQQPLPSHALLRLCPEMARGGRTDVGTQVLLQLMGGHANLMAETARAGAAAGAVGIDLNFGCPVARVNSHDGGAALLKDPTRITSIVRAVRNAVPSTIPVSAKLRVGWSSPQEAPTLAQAVEQGGASMLTMHGRTRLQLYGGPVNWEAIAQARHSVSIPVVANGDIRTPEDLARCAEITGCTRFMIGRGALARPEIFQVLSNPQNTWWSPSQRLHWVCSYGDICLSQGLPNGQVVGRVKGILRYMAADNETIAAVFQRERRQVAWAALREKLLQAEPDDPPECTST